MPLVHVYMWSGVSEDAKGRIIREITKVFEDLEIPRHAVEIITHEIPKENWGIGGEPASERFKEVKPP